MHILFDIDNTLVISEKSVKKYNKTYRRHLTKIYVKHINEFYYAINLKKTSNLFKKLLKNDISVGFITASNYAREEWLRLFEKIYKLDRNALKSCVYINRYHYGDKYTPKGIKINRAIDDMLLNDDLIVLVDDNEEHVDNARKFGHCGIIANGFQVNKVKNPRIDNSYLDEIEYLINNLID